MSPLRQNPPGRYQTARIDGISQWNTPEQRVRARRACAAAATSGADLRLLLDALALWPDDRAEEQR